MDEVSDGINEDSLGLSKSVFPVPKGTEENNGIAEEEIEVLEPLLLCFPRDEPMEPRDTEGELRDVRIEFVGLLEDSLVNLLSSVLKLSGAGGPFSKEFAEKIGGEDLCAFARSARTTRATKLV